MIILLVGWHSSEMTKKDFIDLAKCLLLEEGLIKIYLEVKELP